MKTIYKYEKTRRIAYVVSNLNSGFKVRQISFLVGAIPTNFTDRPPMKYMAVNGLMNNIESGLLIPDWCGGTISIIKINDYTVPAPSRGIIMSTAMATARLSKLPGWLSSPAARAVMANKPDRDYLAHARFEQTSSGWKIMGRVSLPELIGPAGGF